MKTISIDDVVAVIDLAYDGDGAITSYHEDDNIDHGDGLAKFIYHECRDVMGPGLDTVSAKEVGEAAHALLKAEAQLESVRTALHKICAELEAE